MKGTPELPITLRQTADTVGTALLGLETPEKIWGQRSSRRSLQTDGNFYPCVLMLDNASF